MFPANFSATRTVFSETKKFLRTRNCSINFTSCHTVAKHAPDTLEPDFRCSTTFQRRSPFRRNDFRLSGLNALRTPDSFTTNLRFDSSRVSSKQRRLARCRSQWPPFVTYRCPRPRTRCCASPLSRPMQPSVYRNGYRTLSLR
jgi:hypothetical protein